MVTTFASRLAEITAARGPLCVGIDPSAESLAGWGLVNSVDGALEMGRTVLAAVEGRVGIVKPQVGYFERFGASGFFALETLIQEAGNAGLLVIADAKRGDIGSTMESYAAAWLEPGPLKCDAMTAHPFLGFDALEPAVRSAEQFGGAVFVLCATSNPDAPTIQSSQSAGESISAFVARRVRERSKIGAVGVVVGATRDLRSNGLTEHDLVGIPVLAPGFGAQGASLSDLTTIFGVAARNVIPTVSRSVLGGGAAGVGVAIDNHLRELGL
jgi:orotidine-5'-phosphate decarboxylase